MRDDGVVEGRVGNHAGAGAGAESALQALEPLHAMLGAVPAASQMGGGLRLCLVSQIDDDVRAVLAERLDPSCGSEDRHPGSALLARLRDLHGDLFDAYWECLLAIENSAEGNEVPEELAECRIRLLRAGVERLKWERCAGGPGHAGLWARIGSVFGEAVVRNRMHCASAFGVGGRFGSSVEREYLRAVAIFSVGIERAGPELVPVLDRLIDFTLPMLDFRVDAPVGALYYLDRDLCRAPHRLVSAAQVPGGCWFLNTRVACASLQELAAQLLRGLVPMGLEHIGKDRLAAAVRHLLRHWSELPLVRRHRRYAVGGRLTALRGIAELRRLFAGESVSRLEEWGFRDVSRNGIGLAVPPSGAAPVTVGELVGILPEDGDAWQFGIVARAWTEADGVTLVGLDTLGQRPMLVSADDGALRTDVFLCDPLLRGEAVRVVAPADSLRPGAVLSVAASGAVHELKPIDCGMAGADFELRIFQVV